MVRSPLEPLRSITRPVFILVLACYAFEALYTIFGQASLFNLGVDFICVNAPNLAYRVLREAEVAGVFSDRVPGRLRTLGAFLVVAPLATMLIKGVATAYFAASTSRITAGTPFGVTYWQWPLPTLLAGLGALTFARIMRVGARMREDLDGTV